jgi:cobalt-zinc-cadmium efflux system outer membrane protein
MAALASTHALEVWTLTRAGRSWSVTPDEMSRRRPGLSRSRLVRLLSLVALAASIGACARFEPKPISAEARAIEFRQRTLSDEGLRQFLDSAAEAPSAIWPKRQWDLRDLTLAALYFTPDLDVLRAQLAGSRAAEITAAQRLNPSISMSRGTNTTSTGIPSGLDNVMVDQPMRTGGKRGYQRSQAAYLSEAATWSLAATAQQVRTRVRAAMLALYGVRERQSLLLRQESLQDETVGLLETQLGLGAVSAFEVTQARIALQQTRFALLDSEQQQATILGQLADAIGLSPRALDEVEFSFDEFRQLPQGVPDEPERRQALINRADIRSALASYAASQSALQLEIARQYPDIHLGPAYELDQGDTKWFLGVSLELPVLSRNKGPIAEAEARRAESAAQFDALQSRASNQIEQAIAGYRVALRRVSTAEALSGDLQGQERTARSMRELGEISQLELIQRQVELNTGALARLDAIIVAQESLGSLQDALQTAVVLPQALWLSSPRDSKAEQQP